MPDNNNDLQNRLVALEQRISQVQTTDNNPIQATNDLGSTHLNWRALYKWLESEVEELVFDPNASVFVKGWAQRLISEAKSKIDRFGGLDR